MCPLVVLLFLETGWTEQVDLTSVEAGWKNVINMNEEEGVTLLRKSVEEEEEKQVHEANQQQLEMKPEARK